MHQASDTYEPLKDLFGDRLSVNANMAPYTTTKVGGNADALMIVDNVLDLEKVIGTCWLMSLPVILLGSGSNILISEKGIRSAVVINRTHHSQINMEGESPTVWTETGVSLAQLARLAAEAGFSGLEWASPIPGTVGGAIYGNAGAHGGEISKSLILAEILHHDQGMVSLDADQMNFGYRSSLLKDLPGKMVILSGTFRLGKSSPKKIESKMQEIAEKRRCTQPVGPSFGSTFRNPPQDKAGRLIEAAGLKGKTIGGASISEKHANFIINASDATADDDWQLLELAYDSVKEKFGIGLIPEIELVGDWDKAKMAKFASMRGEV
jgi:UDP-N-acetylmuramate dehydrogenase